MDTLLLLQNGIIDLSLSPQLAWLLFVLPCFTVRLLTQMLDEQSRIGG